MVVRLGALIICGCMLVYSRCDESGIDYAYSSCVKLNGSCCKQSRCIRFCFKPKSAEFCFNVAAVIVDLSRVIYISFFVLSFPTSSST